MSVRPDDWLVIGVYAVTVVYRILFRKSLWNQPLKAGDRYFLGMEVPAGFYPKRGLRLAQVVPRGSIPPGDRRGDLDGGNRLVGRVASNPPYDRP